MVRLQGERLAFLAKEGFLVGTISVMLLHDGTVVFSESGSLQGDAFLKAIAERIKKLHDA